MANTYPRLIVPSKFEEDADMIRIKGWYGLAVVEMENGMRCPVYLTDPVRLMQDFHNCVDQGEPFMAEVGMIILPEVTLEAATVAVSALHQRGFFDAFVPNPTKGETG